MRLKKLISGVLAGLTAILSIPFSSVGVIALAADEEKDIWDGTTDTSWYNSEETEFHISTPEELAGLAELVNDGKSMSGQTFILDNDIYLNDVSNFKNWSNTAPKNSWIPIGKSSRFSGIFDGSGFSIEGLYISGSKYQYSGLFGYTTESSEIKNVNMTYEYINNTYSTNKCYAGGITAYSNGKINDCSTDTMSTVESSSLSSYFSCFYGGGIAGYSTAKISNCANNGAVITTITTSSFSSYEGGIVGYSSAEVSNCINNGNVIFSPSSSSYLCIGGIAGSSSAKICNCTNSGTISSLYVVISSKNCSLHEGGIVGESYGNTGVIISNVYNTGSITGTGSLDGVNYVGGIVGGDRFYYRLTVSNAYNVGKVSSAILGINNGSTIVNTSYLIRQSKQGCKGYTDDDEIVAKSKEEMQTKGFAESLGDAFVYVEGDYPKLAWESNGSIEEPTKITSETTSEDTSNTENTTDISETESISTDITESPSESETTTTSTTKVTITATSSYVTTTSTTTTLSVTTMETSTMTTKNTTSTEVTKLSTTPTTKSTTEKTTSVTTTITKPTTTVTTKPTVKISVGDVNDDGSIDSKDAVLVLKYYAESLTGSTTTKITLEKGDVNSDGKIDSKDAVKILKYYAQTMVGLNVDIKDV